MFEAWIFVCFIGVSPKECFPAQDTRGPYKEHQQCYERTVEMAASLLKDMPMYVPVDWKCTKAEGELT